MDFISGDLGRVNPRYFNDFWLFANDLLSFHKIKVYEFDAFHHDVINTILSNRYTLIILPRGHLKTTLLNTYALWRMLRETKYELGLVSSTLDQTIKNLTFIQDMIETTPWMKHLVPEDRSYTWSKSKLTTTNGNTCTVLPFKPSARGAHPNELLYDDIMREKDIDMDEIKDTFWHIFFPMGQTKNCKHTVVGTPISAEDLFVEIQDKVAKGSPWRVLRRQAIEANDEGKEVPLWSSRFSLEELSEIKDDMGTYRFNREFLCDPLAAGAGFFPPEMILNATEDDLTFNYQTQGVVAIGADFAMSESASGDYNCFTVIDSINGTVKRDMEFNGEKVTVEVENPVVIKYIDRWKGPTGQARRLKELSDTYKATKVIVDISTFGQKFAQELRELGVSVDGQDFRPANRSQLLVNLRRLFESDDIQRPVPRMIIPSSQENFTYDKTKHLIKELSGFRETKTKAGSMTLASNLAHDDTVMSLALAVKDVAFLRSIPTKLVWEIDELQEKEDGFKIERGIDTYARESFARLQQR